MADDQDFSEEYVLELLKKDAKKVSTTYNRSGTYDVLPKRPTGAAPKPNTRFLRNIVREADNHNAALKQKELSDAGRRLRAMAKEKAEQARWEKDPSSRKRHGEDSEDDEGDVRRQKREYARRDGSRDSRGHERRRHRSGSRSPRSRRRKDEIFNRSRSPRHGRNKEPSHSKSTSPDHRKHRRRRFSESPSSDYRRQRRSNHNRSRSPRPRKHHRDRHQTRIRDSESSDSEALNDRCSRRETKPNNHKEAIIPNPMDRSDDDDDDDPLSSFLGPKPVPKQAPPALRGRGATAFVSGIDQRFSSAYDPTSDIQPDANAVREDEDWEQALEALRDRQKFRQAGADRLLAAGFTKEEVERMDRGGEKNEADVRWTKKGEAREWDRGKTFDENGHVSVDGDKFGRLL